MDLSLAPRFFTERTTRSRVAVGLLGVSLGVALGPSLLGCQATKYVDHGLEFEQHQLDTGRARSQTVLPGVLMGGDTADLAVVSATAQGARSLRIYTHEGESWAPAMDVPVDPGVLFVDVARCGELDRLLLLRSDGVRWFDPRGAEERLLVEVEMPWKATGPGIPHVDVTRDLNDDGRDDLVLPDVDGFWIAIQTVDGSFTEAVKLGPPEPFLDAVPLEKERPYREVGLTAETLPWYQSRVHELDFDRDGRSDLAFWNDGRLDVHRQDATGAFEPAPLCISIGARIDSDGVYSHAFGYEGEGACSLLLGLRERSARTVLHSFRDVNGDDVADLVTHTLSGRSVVKLASTLAVHFGEPTNGGIHFPSEPSTTIRPRGSQPAGYSLQRFADLDGDGRLEAVLANVDAGVGDMFQALIASSIDVDLYVFRLEDGGYPKKPAMQRRVKPDSHLFSRRGPFFPTVLEGDVTGDGLSDLLVGQGWEELRVYVGVSGAKLFAERPQKVSVELPADERNARVFDINADGRDDVLIHHPSEREPNRLTLLVAR